MRRILLITSSPRSASYSTRVARALAERLAAALPKSVIMTRDLTRDPPPHIDDTFAIAREVPVDRLTSAQLSALRLSNALIEELLSASIIIVAAGMINFGIPSNLKAYIDYILRPRVTFRYTEKGPEGLVKGKKAYLVLARGGDYSGPHMQQLNFQDTYLRAALGFIGLTDIEIIALEGVSYGPEVAENALAAAMEKVARIAA